MKEMICKRYGKHYYKIHEHWKHSIYFLVETINQILDEKLKSISFIIPLDSKSITMKVISIDKAKKTFVAELKNEKYLIKIIDFSTE